jgi:hypothetical protein
LCNGWAEEAGGAYEDLEEDQEVLTGRDSEEIEEWITNLITRQKRAEHERDGVGR